MYGGLRARHRHGVHRRAGWAVGALLLVGLIGSPAGSAGPTTKPYTASIAPAAVGGGSSTTFTETVTNQADPQQLGSLNLTAPPGFTITGAVLGGPGTILPPAGPSLVQLRDLNLAPGATLTFDVTATVPCTGGLYTWGITAKQANDYNGDPGNDFVTASVLTTTVSSGCRLVFVNQPAGAEVDAILTSARFDAAGPPITVAAVDGDGNLVTSATADVSVALSPSPGALSGTTSRPLVGGVAAFDDLSVGVIGPSFTLEASSPGYTSATSEEFDVVTEGVLCTGGGPCGGGAAGGGTTTSVSAAGLGAGTTSLGITLLDTPAFPVGVCGLFVALGSGATVDIRPLPGLTEITVRLDKAIVNAKPTPNGATTFNLCIGTNLAFPTKDGSPNVFDGSRFWGLAPNCPKTITTPCVTKRNKNQAGDVILVGAVPTPYDPDVWGG